MNQTLMAPERPQAPQQPALIALPTFDLSRQLARLAKEHPDWNSERLAAAEHDYRLFIQQCKLKPQSSNSPGRDADVVWHAHILFTRQYARDCQNYCGHFVHHNPLDGTDKCNDIRKADCRPCDTDPNEIAAAYSANLADCRPCDTDPNEVRPVH